MKLIYKHGKERHFKITKFPDGQHNVILDMHYFNNPKEPVIIDCSIRDFTELEILLCIIASIRSADLIVGRVNFYYLFGLRSDRKFENGSCNYVEHVLAPIIRAIDKSSLWPCNFLTPHGRSYTYLFCRDYGYEPYIFVQLPSEFHHMQRIAGDESAVKLIHPFGYSSIIHFNKERKLNGMQIGLKQEYKEAIMNSDLPILIMDDICDGGATFLKEAEYLKDIGIVKPGRKLNLFVYHGIFSAGFTTLFHYFDKIYTTNSYQEFEPREKLHVIDVWGA